MAGDDLDGDSTDEVTLEEQTLDADADDGASIEITGNLPTEATVRIEPVTLDREALDRRLGKAVVDGIDSIVIYDISILLDGEEWEPDDTVQVAIHNPAVCPLDGDEDAEPVEVDLDHLVAVHLEENGASQDDDADEATSEEESAPDNDNEDQTETEDESQDENTSETGDDTAATVINTDYGTATILDTTASGDTITFETDSFSEYGFITYTVDYYYNSAEYHQDGGSTMSLSDLLEALSIDVDLMDITDVTFTDSSLLGVERDGDDWNLISLLPFDTEETLTLTLADGDPITIETRDSHAYPRYEVDNSDMKAFAGEIKNDEGNNYIGRYNIFGGGNGIAATLTPQEGYDGGTWGYDGTDSQDCLYNLKTYRVDEYGNMSQDKKNSNYVSTSVGTITWDGSLERAYFSFGYLATFGSNSRKLVVKVTGPQDGTRTITIYPKSKDWNDDRPDAYVGSNLDWSYLTFDATTFVEQEGTGLYTVQVTATGSGSGDDRLGDMGWTIYGVSYDPDQDYNTIIAGSIGEFKNNASNPAKATFSPAITPSGAGKVWYNVQGGETRNGSTDQDYLLVTKQGGGSIYLGDGSNGSVKVTTNGNTWQTNDIARPNEYQTPPDTDASGKAYAKFSNQFSFAMGEFDSMSSVPINGIRKTISAGTDAFGSIMLMARISSSGSNPIITKRLDIPYSDDVDRIKNGLNGNTLPFRFEMEFLSMEELATNATTPMPDGYDKSTYETTGKYIYTVNIARDKIADAYAQTLTPDFTTALMDAGQTTKRIYRYKVTEVNDKAENWTYDTTAYYLEFTVEPYDTSTAVHTISYKWTDEDGNEFPKNASGEYTTAGIFKNTYATDHIVRTGVHADTYSAMTILIAASLLALAYATAAKFVRPQHHA